MIYSILEKPFEGDILYSDYIQSISEKSIDGVAVGIAEVHSIRGNKYTNLNIDTAMLNGSMKSYIKKDDFIGGAIDLFLAIDTLEIVETKSNFYNNNYWIIDINMDFIEPDDYDLGHRLFLLIDKKTYNIFIPEKKAMDISFLNYVEYKSNNHIKEVVTKLIEGLSNIGVIEAVVNKGQNYGADMVELDYASDDIVIFHGSFGLFVYDLNDKRVTYSLDLKSLECSNTQGDAYCDVSVNEDGNMIQLHNISKNYMYRYDLNIIKKITYKPMEHSISRLITYDEIELENTINSYYCIKFNEDDYGYLITEDFTIDTLKYVRGDKTYNIFNIN